MASFMRMEVLWLNTQDLDWVDNLDTRLFACFLLILVHFISRELVNRMGVIEHKLGPQHEAAP